MLLVTAACNRSSVEPKQQVLRGEAFGSTWQVKWVGEADPKTEQALLEALERVDESMSTWRPDSELMAVRGGDGAVAVSKATFDVVTAALQLADATGGAFDPTVQPLMEFWGFHGDTREMWPSDEEVAAQRERVGYRKVKPVRGLDGHLTIDAGGTALDLSAIAKGYAVDRLSFVLSEQGHSRHLVEIGGEVVARGESPRGGGWILGVDKPIKASLPATDFAAIFELSDAAMATSGNYRSRVKVGDREVGHTLDPRTGFPIESEIRSATVIAPNCMQADGLATALMVLGVDEGLSMIETLPGVAAFLQVDDGSGIREVASSRLSDHRRKR